MNERVVGPFDPLAIIGVLNAHGVRFIVIGGIAAGVQGAMWATTDLDISTRATATIMLASPMRSRS